ncbi:MAG: acyltransferase [Edaphobacter sp.]
MPGLDVLRGLAIGGVIMYHGVVNAAQIFHPQLSSWQYASLNFFKQGAMGVPLFFVLSGFLITGILLDTRTNPDYFKTFYLRRVLRIVPVYLLMIIILKSMDEISWTFVLVSLLYLCNMTHSANIGQQYGVFWSLSVEEQFYLFWPLVIRKLSPRRSFYVALSLLFAVPLLRFILLGLPPGFRDIYYKVWSIADFFAGGALMSMAIRSSRLRPMLPVICAGAIALSALLFAFFYAISDLHSPLAVRTMKATAMCPFVLLFSGAVLLAYLRPSIASSAVGRFFVFMGYISYGLYLCHPLIQTLIERRWTLAAWSGNALYARILIRFVAEMTLAIGISYLSRRTFENYFLKLKPRQREIVQDLKLVQ